MGTTKNLHSHIYIYILSNYLSIMLIVLYADTLFFSKGVSHSASLWEAKLRVQQNVVHASTFFSHVKKYTRYSCLLWASETCFVSKCKSLNLFFRQKVGLSTYTYQLILFRIY